MLDSIANLLIIIYITIYLYKTFYIEYFALKKEQKRIVMEKNTFSVPKYSKKKAI